MDKNLPQPLWIEGARPWGSLPWTWLVKGRQRTLKDTKPVPRFSHVIFMTTLLGGQWTHSCPHFSEEDLDVNFYILHRCKISTQQAWGRARHTTLVFWFQWTVSYKGGCKNTDSRSMVNRNKCFLFPWHPLVQISITSVAVGNSKTLWISPWVHL